MSWETLRPATLAARTTWRALSSSRSSRTRSTSARSAGTQLPGPDAALVSSSTKNALPSARSTMSASSFSASPSGTSSAISARTASSGSGDERDPVDAADAGPLGDLAAQRVAAVQVVGAVRRDHGDRADERAGEEEAEQVAGRLVGPVGVLDDEQQRRLLGGRLEQGVDGLEEVGAVERGGPVGAAVRAAHAPGGRAGAGRAAGCCAATCSTDVGQVGGEPAEDLGEREVGQRAVAEVEAVAGEDLPALGEGEVAQLGEEPGLADAGVAGEQDDADAAPAYRSGRTDAEQRSDLRQLGVSPDQGPAGVCCHAAHDPVFCCRMLRCPLRPRAVSEPCRTCSPRPARAGRCARRLRRPAMSAWTRLQAVVQLGLHVVAVHGVVVHGGLLSSWSMRRDSSSEVGPHIGQSALAGVHRVP